MKRLVLTLLIGLTLMMALSSCAAKKATDIATNPQVKQDLAHAEAIVKGCLVKGDVLTKAGRTKIIACIAPPGHTVEFQKCVQTDVAHSHFFTKKQRATFLQGVATCLEKNR